LRKEQADDAAPQLLAATQPQLIRAVATTNYDGAPRKNRTSSAVWVRLIPFVVLRATLLLCMRNPHEVDKKLYLS